MSLPHTARIFVFLIAPFIVASCASSAPPVQEPPQKKSDARNKAQELISGKNPGTATTAPDATNGSTASGSSATAAATAAVEKEQAPAPESASAASGITPQEQQYLNVYLSRLKYLVTIKGDGLNDFQAKSVAAKANEFLLKQGYDVVQYEQLQKNLEDQRTAFESEVGEGMSLIQYVAQKLGADVYVELEAVPRPSSDGSKHYGSANFTAGIYDPSTAELLGSVTFTSDRSFSTSSEDEAVMNALVAGTAQLMPRVVRDSVNTLKNRYANGIRYQVVIQKTPDSRLISTFRRNLRPRIKDIVMGPSAADQTTMDVYLFGSMADLEDACYAAFERTAGMESAYWVYTRGKAITFNSGM